VLWAILGVGVIATSTALLAPRSVGLLLKPLERLHQEWVSERIELLTAALARFRAAPRVLMQCFLGAIVVQGTMVGFYAAIARGLHIPAPIAHLAILIPLSFIVQMLPVSVNGFGVR